MKPIAICQNKKIFDHSTDWTPRLIEYCRTNGIDYEIVDCYKSDIIRKLPNYSGLIWLYKNFVISDLMEARNILQVAHNLGLETFPKPIMNWHFDDKIAEMYALDSVNAPTPKYWVFYDQDECIEWLENEAEYPVIAKLRCGSGSNNVKMIRNKRAGKHYAKRLFGKGLNPTPSLGYKAFSKLQSSKNIDVMIKRIKKIPEFLNTRRHAKKMPIEKGYCNFQEFIPNEGYDLKIVVIGDKLTFCSRKVRKYDFRASGGGDISYDRGLVTDQIIDSAFSTAEKLEMDCVGFDYVVDEKTKTGKIIEMCYGFDYVVQKELGAYVDKNHQWHEEGIVIPDEIIKMMLRRIENKK